jgi:hypothetical protein
MTKIMCNKGGLDTRESNRKEAEARLSGETPKKKIDSSTVDEQVSNESVPDASITPNIQVLDERKIRFRIHRIERRNLRTHS